LKMTWAQGFAYATQLVRALNVTGRVTC
jgi:hypothetical protein